MEGGECFRGNTRVATVQARAGLDRSLACATPRRGEPGFAPKVQGLYGAAGTRQPVPGRTRKVVRSVPGMESPREELRRLGCERCRAQTTASPRRARVSLEIEWRFA